MLCITEEDFETQVRNYAINMDFDEDLISKFLNKWCAVNEGGWKMAWQKETTFDIKRRMGTFIINKNKWEKNVVRLMPNYYDKNYEYKLGKEKGNNEVMKYHRHLIGLGWKKLHGPGGTNWKKP